MRRESRHALEWFACAIWNFAWLCFMARTREAHSPAWLYWSVVVLLAVSFVACVAAFAVGPPPERRR